MDVLIGNKHKIFEIKENIKTNVYYTHTVLHEHELSNNTVSIVMAASNRSVQTYYTLKTIMRNKHKDIQVIIVDDSTHDKITVEKLKEYPFMIDFIEINRQTKVWANPCVTYNIGFQFVRGGKVIIQNAEVCHVGYLVDYIVQNITNDSVYVPFNVASIKNMEYNNIIYSNDTSSIDIYNHSHIYGSWYQRVEADYNRGFHFLIAMTRNAFDIIEGFSYDYICGTEYDDDDFVMKITSKGIKKASVSHGASQCGGIHLFHESSANTWAVSIPNNRSIFEKKQAYYNRTGQYMEISESIDMFDTNIQLLG